MWVLEQRILAEVLQTHFKSREEIRCLDFACGTGRLTQFIEPQVGASTAVDISAPMLAVAAGKLRRTHLIQADLTTNNILAGQRFNLITAFRFFANAEPELRRTVMAVLADLLDSEGCLIFNNHHNLTSPYMLLSRILDDPLANTQRLRYMSRHDMRRLAEGAGLKIVDLFHTTVLFPRMTRLLGDPRTEAIEAALAKQPWMTAFSDNVIAVCQRRRRAR